MTTNQQDAQQDAQNPIPTDTQAQKAAFFARADDIITLANAQLSPQSHAGQVTASLTFAAARFAVSSAAIGFTKGVDLTAEKADIVAFYVKQYEQMLKDNIDDYAAHFAEYTGINKAANKATNKATNPNKN